MLHLLWARLRRPVAVSQGWFALEYGLFVIVGFVLIWNGSPSIERATSAGYLTTYGLVVTLAALLTLIGSLTRELVEMIGALLLWAWLLVYDAAIALRAFTGDSGALAIFIIVCISSLLPAVRGFSLLFQTISRWRGHRG